MRKFGFRIVVTCLLTAMTIFCTVAYGGSVPPLIRAAEGNDINQVKRLLEEGVDVNARDSFTAAPALIHASRNGNLQVVRVLLEKGADVNAKNKHGFTALIQASMYAHPDTARLLLERGADVNAKDNMGSTALIYAAEVGRLDCAKVLLENGADVNSRNNNGETALTHAVGLANYIHDAHHDIVRLLLTKGADVNAVDQDYGLTALGTASLKGQCQVTALLMAYGARELGHGYEKMALLFAAKRNGLKQVRNLLEKGVDVNAKPSQGWTALMLAAGEGHLDVVRLLLEKGADVNAKTETDGKTALADASKNGHFGVVRLLLENGADVHAKDVFGWTALDVSRGHRKIEALLKLHGAKE
jgi:ankyrin repeat protein